MSAPNRRPSLLLKDVAGLLLYYPGQSFVSAAPRGLLGPLSAVGGDLTRKLSGEGEQMADELRKLFGDTPMPDDVNAIIRRAYRQAMFNEVEVLRYPALGTHNIDDVVKIEGQDNLDAALSRGKGAILLIGHFGANQMIMPALGHKGYPMNQLSAPPTVWADILRDTRTTPLWEKVLERRWELEQRLPVRHINVFRFLRPAFDCLAANEVLGLAFDGGGGARWTDVQLMARVARVPTQPAQLWHKSGAALLPTVVLRTPEQKRHTIIIEPALDWQPSSDRKVAVQTNMQAFADRFSSWVARHPDHYLPFLMMRRRVRGTDMQPFFDDYPPSPDALSKDEAAARLARAGRSAQ